MISFSTNQNVQFLYSPLEIYCTKKVIFDIMLFCDLGENTFYTNFLISTIVKCLQRLDQNRVILCPGGREYLAKFSTGEASPRAPIPYPFIYHFIRKGTLLTYLLSKKRYPFHIPTFGGLVLIFM